jgi:nucleotidyltransferase/DNA polymerase involved in DNA repair
MQKGQPERIVIFFDMDCFYCQVETRRLGVSPDTPLVVDQWGMLLSVNYAAKAIGVSRKSTAKEAREKGCLVVHVGLIDLATGEHVNDVNAGYRDRGLYKATLDRYREASEEVMTVIRAALPPSSYFERASVDECYADVLASDLADVFPSLSDADKLKWEANTYRFPEDEWLARGAFLGERVRSEIFSLTSFTVSCGVSETRQVAKLCCSLNKPDKLTVVSSSRTSEFMKTVPLKEIRGLGPRGMEVLQSRVPWVTTSTLCGQVWEVDLGTDDFARWLAEAVRGLNDSPVKETGLNPASSGASKQFRPPLPFLEAEAMIRSLCADMIERLGGREGNDGETTVKVMPKSLVVTLSVTRDLTRSRQAPWPVGGRNAVSELAIELAYRTGLMSPTNSFERIAVNAKDVSEEETVTTSDGLQKARKNVTEYLTASRLHFMGTWKTRYLQYIHQVEETGDWGDGQVGELSWRAETSDPSTPWFLLVDMDCFFVSVAVMMRGADPNMPAAVASGLGATSEICSANYPARQFGVHANSFVQTAREKCPEIIIYPVDPGLLNECEKIWKKVIHVLFIAGGGRFGVIQGKSCDEALLRVDGVVSEDLAKFVQESVLFETGVPCSVGIAPTRILAKMATSLAKPKGIRTIPSIADGEAILREMKVHALPGVGYSTRTKLSDLGIETVSDLLVFYKRSPEQLISLFGANTTANLINTATGIDNPEDIAKEISTVSAEKNFGFRNLTKEAAVDVIVALCENVTQRIPPKAGVEKVVLKLKMAPDGWVEPSKKGGIGNVYDFTRSANFTRGLNKSDPTNFSKLVVPFLNEVDPDRIRGLGVSVRLTWDTVGTKRALPGQHTLENMWNGDTAKSTKIIASSSSSTKLTVDPFAMAGPTSVCVVCGDRILVGSLVPHFLSHSRTEEMALCPICNQPIELDDTFHVAQHFMPR